MNLRMFAITIELALAYTLMGGGWVDSSAAPKGLPNPPEVNQTQSSILSVQDYDPVTDTESEEGIPLYGTKNTSTVSHFSNY